MLQPEVRCVEFVDEVTEWMEGGLTDDQRLLLEEHLAICPHCTRYLDQLRAAWRCSTRPTKSSASLRPVGSG